MNIFACCDERTAHKVWWCDGHRHHWQRQRRKKKKRTNIFATECQHRCQIFVTRRFEYPFMAFRQRTRFFFRSLARVVYRSVAFQYLIKYDKINRRTMAYRRHFFVVRQTAVQCCLMVVPVPPGSVSPSDVAIVCVRRRTYERDIKIHFLQSCDATHTQHPGSRATSILEGAGCREAKTAQGIRAYMKMIMQSQQLETLLTLITLPERSLSSRLSLAHELQTIALVFDGSTQLKRRA